MTESVSEATTKDAAFNIDDWLTSSGEAMASSIKNKFLALPDHLYDATQEGFFDVCLLSDIESQQEFLKSLNSDYEPVHVPDRGDRAKNILNALHCHDLSDYDPGVVNGLPEIIILAYKLDGESGETLFGVEGQKEVLTRLRSFKYSKPDGMHKEVIRRNKLAITVSVVAALAFIGSLI